MAPVKVAGWIRGMADQLWRGSNITWRSGVGNKREENALEQEGLQWGRTKQGEVCRAWLGELGAPCSIPVPTALLRHP